MIHQKYKGIISRVEVKHSDGTSSVFNPFNNLIHNAGLDFIGTGMASAATAFCRASTNSDEPLTGDTTLSNQLGSASVSATQVLTNSGGTPDWFYQMERVYTFAVGSVVGNVSKFGFFSAATGGTMFSSALTKDPAGDPTSIPVTADDQLFVTWQLRKYISITPVTGNIDISFDGSPTSVAYEILPSNLGNVNDNYYFQAHQSAGNINISVFTYETQTLGSVNSVPAGSQLNCQLTLSGYSNGNYFRDINITANTSQANFVTGIGSIVYCSLSGVTVAGYQISFNPKLPKDADSTLSLPMRISWGRA